MIAIQRFYKVCALALTLAGTQVNVGARSLKDFFSEMPFEILPLLTQNDRLDFADYRENNMRARVTNTFGGESEMTDLTDDYFHIVLSKSDEMSAKLLLSEEGDTIICVTKTYATPIPDTDIHFYNTKWEAMDTKKILTAPAYKGYWLSTDTLTQEEYEGLQHKVDMYTTEAILSPETTDITYRLHVQVLEKKDEERITPLIKTQTLHWNGKRFSL